MSECNLDARVAVLEEIAAATKQTLAEIRADIRDLRTGVDRRFDQMDGRFDRLDGEMWRNFRWLLGVMLAGFAGLLAALAHGFHWL